MTWHTWKSALTLGAVLAVTGAASAGDRDTMLLSGGPAKSNTTMTLGGTGTAAQAATEDLELTGHGGYRGGYYGHYHGGYYRGYGYGGYYRPYYVGYYRPYYGYSYYRPYYGYGIGYYPGYYPYYSGVGVYIGIDGGAASGAPTVPLGGDFSRPTSPPMAQPAPPGGTLPYDGGPVNPVPLPKADPQPIPTVPGASATDLPISVKPKTTPSKYKAYGEK